MGEAHQGSCKAQLIGTMPCAAATHAACRPATQVVLYGLQRKEKAILYGWPEVRTTSEDQEEE